MRGVQRVSPGFDNLCNNKICILHKKCEQAVHNLPAWLAVPGQEGITISLNI